MEVKEEQTLPKAEPEAPPLSPLAAMAVRVEAGLQSGLDFPEDKPTVSGKGTATCPRLGGRLEGGVRNADAEVSENVANAFWEANAIG
eukprot:428506-Prorocentrum_minimum.AAC.1